MVVTNIISYNEHIIMAVRCFMLKVRMLVLVGNENNLDLARYGFEKSSFGSRVIKTLRVMVRVRGMGMGEGQGEG
jgi:hypothetical protein